MVKCLICGAVFAAGPEKCPVCGVGKENFVEAEPAGAAGGFKKNTAEIFLILGSGAAAVTAAEAIRKRNDSCSIIIMSREGVPPCNRPMLTKSIAGGIPPEGIAIHSEDWYTENNIYRMLDKEIVALDPAAREVRCADGTVFSYDKCVYALGAECFVPPMPGVELPQVVSIRRVEDLEKIRELLPETKNALVVGGGVLGLEAAWGLRQAGCRVTVLDTSAQIMNKQLDQDASQIMESAMAQKDIELIKEARSSEILSENGKVTGLRLADGRELPGDLVILSTGVRPNLDVAKSGGLEIGRSIVVNDRMETSVPAVYACGDCAEFGGVNYSLWSQAVGMGQVAGANAAGDDLRYETVDGALSFHGLDLSLFAIGDNGKDPGKDYTAKEVRGQGTLEKYYYADGRLCGAILLGDTSKMAEVTARLKADSK